MDQTKPDTLTPEIKEEFETMYRKERMLEQKFATERQCVACKVVSAALFAGAGLFHGYRMSRIWSLYPLREKVFNVAALGFFGAVAVANLNAANQIYLGQTMQVVETRPSIFRRLTGQVDPLSPDDRIKYLEKLIKIEEEKEELARQIKQASIK